MNRIKMRFNATLENETVIRNAIGLFATTVNCTIEDIIDVKTIVSEAVTNAIIHGYEDSLGMVRLDGKICGNIVEVVVNGEGEFDKIYTIGKNYYEWNGEAFTEISGYNFCEAQISFEEAYASEDDMPEYVIENQVKPTGVQITNKVETMDAFTTHQIAVKLSPEDVTNKKVQYITSDSSVATVSTAG